MLLPAQIKQCGQSKFYPVVHQGADLPQDLVTERCAVAHIDVPGSASSNNLSPVRYFGKGSNAEHQKRHQRDQLVTSPSLSKHVSLQQHTQATINKTISTLNNFQRAPLQVSLTASNSRIASPKSLASTTAAVLTPQLRPLPPTNTAVLPSLSNQTTPPSREPSFPPSPPSMEVPRKPTAEKKAGPTLDLPAISSPPADTIRRVSAVVRIRPPATDDIPSEQVGISVTGPKSLEVFVPVSYNARLAQRSLEYHVDRVLGSSATQQQVWETVAPALEGIMRLNGSSVTVMAFGATGTGKTYTMLGPEAKQLSSLTRTSISRPGIPNPSNCQYDVFQLSEQKGILPRLCHALFDRLQRSPDWPHIKIYVSNFEIYKEKLIDLLADLPQSKSSQRRASSTELSDCSRNGLQDSAHTAAAILRSNESLTRWSQSPSSHCTFSSATLSRGAPTAVSGSVTGLRWIQVLSCNDLTELLVLGTRRRASRQTRFNDHSSRSHAVWQICIERWNGESRLLVGELQFVDLAGAERSSPDLQSNSVHSQEMAAINKSLCSLSQCIEHLAKRPDAYRPFRDSKLTRLLVDKLKGQGQLVMIFTASPFIKHYRASLLTLQLARAVLASPYYTLPPTPLAPVVLACAKEKEEFQHRCSSKESEQEEEEKPQSIIRGLKKPRAPRRNVANLSRVAKERADNRNKLHAPNLGERETNQLTDVKKQISVSSAYEPSSESLRTIVCQLWRENQALKRQLQDVLDNTERQGAVLSPSTVYSVAPKPSSFSQAYHYSTSLMGKSINKPQTNNPFRIGPDLSMSSCLGDSNSIPSSQLFDQRNVEISSSLPRPTRTEDWNQQQAFLQQHKISNTSGCYGKRTRCYSPFSGPCDEQRSQESRRSIYVSPNRSLRSSDSWCFRRQDNASETTASDKRFNIVERQSTAGTSFSSDRIPVTKGPRNRQSNRTSVLLSAVPPSDSYPSPPQSIPLMACTDGRRLVKQTIDAHPSSDGHRLQMMSVANCNARRPPSCQSSEAVSSSNMVLSTYARGYQQAQYERPVHHIRWPHTTAGQRFKTPSFNAAQPGEHYSSTPTPQRNNQFARSDGRRISENMVFEQKSSLPVPFSLHQTVIRAGYTAALGNTSNPSIRIN